MGDFFRGWRHPEPLTARTLAWLTVACGVIAVASLLAFDGEREADGVVNAIFALVGATLGAYRYRKRLHEDQHLAAAKNQPGPSLAVEFRLGHDGNRPDS